MSIDPATGTVAGTADIAALVDAELAQLAADGAGLRAMLVENATVTAHVLPSNGLTDVLEILGRRVAAALPPNVRPGDVLQVRVTGFEGERVVVQILGPAAPVAAPMPQPAPPNALFVPVADGAEPPAPPTPVADPGSAPREAGATTPTAPLVVAARAYAPAAGAAPPPQGLPRPAVVPLAEPTSIEARLAAARAALPSRTSDPVAQPATAPGTPVPAAARSGPTPAASAAGVVVTPQRYTVAPQIAAKGASEPMPPAVASRAAHAASPSPYRTGLVAYAEPGGLLRALRLPITASNVASASLAIDHPERLPAALAALDEALPRAAEDPNVATLKTLLAYVGRIDPRSPALAAQISAYVEHVVDGPEPKLATLLAARDAASSGAKNEPAPSSVPAGAGAAKTPIPTSPVAAALAAERSAALSANLKQTLLAVVADRTAPASAGPALAGALTALTAVQVGAAQTLAANPNGIAFTIPLTTEHGPANARISVKRDAPNGRGVPLDGENFHVSFVLDTAHFGTVAIDLVTVGREVTVDVRTEAASAMRAFRDALGTLAARLETLRYRVASADASVGVPGPAALETPPSPQRDDADAGVDRKA